MLFSAIESSEHELLPWGVSFGRVVLILAAVTVVEAGTILLADPWHELANARNAERVNHVNTIANAYYVRYAEMRGIFSCASGPVPAEPVPLQSEGEPALLAPSKVEGSQVEGYDLAPCLVPEYLLKIPIDPGDPNAYYRSAADYRSGYWWLENPVSGRLVVIAPSAELGATIEVER